MATPAPVVTTLDPGEEFVSVSPSGQHLLTVTDGSAPDAPRPQWCFRSDDDDATTSCTDSFSDHGALAWSPDESQLAFVQHDRPRPQLPGHTQIQVLDVSTGAVRAAYPEDSLVPRAPALTWSAEGLLLHTWPAEENTELRALDPTAEEWVPQVLQDLGDVAVERLERTEETLVFVGDVEGKRGIYDLGDSTGEADLLARFLSSEIVHTGDGTGRWVAQAQDAHGLVPPVIYTASTGAEVELPGVSGTSAASAFGPSGKLATLTLLPEDDTVTVLDEELQVIDEVHLDRPDGATYDNVIAWTGRGVTLVRTFPEGPQQVVVHSL